MCDLAQNNGRAGTGPNNAGGVPSVLFVPPPPPGALRFTVVSVPSSDPPQFEVFDAGIYGPFDAWGNGEPSAFNWRADNPGAVDIAFAPATVSISPIEDGPAAHMADPGTPNPVPAGGSSGFSPNIEHRSYVDGQIYEVVCAVPGFIVFTVRLRYLFSGS